MIDAAYVIGASKLFGAWTLSDAATRAYRKELIREGKFIDAQGREFEISLEDLQHWVRTFDEFMASGIEVPVPIEHTTDPEKRRGTVIGMELGTDARGKRGLYGVVKFRDAEAEKLATTVDASIYVPPSWRDGQGRTWSRPIRHVALTDYPVVSGLDKFTAIAASMIETDDNSSHKQGDTGVDITKLNAAIEAATAAAETTAVATKALQALAKNPMDEAAQTAAVDASAACKTANADAAAALDAMLGTTEPPKPEPKPEPKPGEPPKPIAASFVGMLKDNRTLKIDSLVKEFKISSAVAQQLKIDYCGDAALALSLGGADDGFDRMMIALAKNEPILSSKERTGVQALRLSHAVDADKNPLIKDAERRASTRKEKR